MQTRWFIKHPYYRGPDQPRASEAGFGNFTLGDTPSVARVNYVSAASIALNLLIANALPSDTRRVWQIVWIAGEADAVHNNAMLGVKIAF